MKGVNVRVLLLILIPSVMFTLAGCISESARRMSGETTVRKEVQPFKLKVQVMLKSVDLIYNNHVGNEWITYSTVDGHRITRYQKFEGIYDGPEAALKFYAYAREEDKHPDIGSSSRVVNLKFRNGTRNTQSINLDVRVIEGEGRYAGNSALWRFTYEVMIQPQGPTEKEKVETQEVEKHEKLGLEASILWKREAPKNIGDLSVSSLGEYVLFTGRESYTEKTSKVWLLSKEGDVLWEYKVEGAPTALLSLGENFVLLYENKGLSGRSKLHFLDISGKLLWTYTQQKTTNEFTDIAISPNEDYIVAGGYEYRQGYIYFFDTEGNLLRKKKVEGRFVDKVEISRNGKYIVVYDRHNVYLFSIEELKRVKRKAKTEFFSTNFVKFRKNLCNREKN